MYPRCDALPQCMLSYMIYATNMLIYEKKSSFNLYLSSSLQQSSWVIQVELAIGPEEGISYLTDKGSTVSSYLDHMVLHSQI